MKQISILSMAVTTLVGFGTIFVPEDAQAKGYQNTRVLVVGEDSDPVMPHRSNAIYRTVGKTLNEWLHSNGYQVLQERSLKATRKTQDHRLNTRQIIRAAQKLQTQNIDMMVIYQVNHDVERQPDGGLSTTVHLTGKLVDLPSGKVVDTVSLQGIDQSLLPYGCKVSCRARHAYDVANEVAPAFAEDTVTQMMQTNWRADQRPQKVKKQATWQDSSDEPAQVHGYSIVLKDFRPAEIKRIMRVFHRHADRIDVWTVRDTRDSRTLWLEAEARPAKLRKALKKLLKATGLQAQIRRTERGFTVVRDARTANVKIIKNSDS